MSRGGGGGGAWPLDIQNMCFGGISGFSGVVKGFWGLFGVFIPPSGKILAEAHGTMGKLVFLKLHLM